MASEQVMLSRGRPDHGSISGCGTGPRILRVGLLLDLTFLAFMALLAVGCKKPQGATPLVGPYPERQIWAIAPLVNESGSTHADGFALADRFAWHLTNAAQVDVVPLNRTIAAMQQLRMSVVASPDDASRVMKALGVDGLIIGSVTAYDPYDPPTLGLIIELHLTQRAMSRAPSLEQLRRFVVTASDRTGEASANPTATAHGGGTSLDGHWGSSPVSATPPAGQLFQGGPASVENAVFDASQPRVIALIKRYASDRGRDGEAEAAWHRYRVSMDLYSDFVSYVMSWRLLRHEADRLIAIRRAEEVARARELSEDPSNTGANGSGIDASRPGVNHEARGSNTRRTANTRRAEIDGAAAGLFGVGPPDPISR